MITNQQLIERDLSVLWHPCTQMKDHEWLPLVPIKSGSGIWLEDFDGNRYMDAISSWWVNLFGHANPYINAQITQQMASLEHVILAGFSHQPVIELSERLVALTPPGLDKCFYADNGSSAIEAALKMSYHYWRNCGQNQKTKFITLSNSYHGETLGALSVGDVSLYKETYQPLLFQAITVTSPDSFNRATGETEAEYAERIFIEMEHALVEHAESVAAVIVEPLVQCAGSMRMYHPRYLELLREACNRYNVHLIADEIAVGFGRTGTLFACEQAQISPDFLVLSKGLTGGYLPLAVVLTGNHIYQAFYDDYQTMRAFLHSHSYTGNALACRAALATLDLFAKDDVIVNNRATAECMTANFAHLRDHPHVLDVRQRGMILAVEMGAKGSQDFAWQKRRGLTVYQYALKNSALLRPLGNVIYLMPPYIINPDQIQHLANVVTDGITLAARS